MISIDTNILARFYIEAESDAEAKKQRPAAEHVLASEAVFVSRSVVLELEWLMRGYYKLPREKFGKSIAHLLSLSNIFVENEGMVAEALRHYTQGMDFADAMHLAASDRCASFATFDAHFKKSADRLNLKPPCIVPG